MIKIIYWTQRLGNLALTVKSNQRKYTHNRKSNFRMFKKKCFHFINFHLSTFKVYPEKWEVHSVGCSLCHLIHWQFLTVTFFWMTISKNVFVKCMNGIRVHLNACIYIIHVCLNYQHKLSFKIFPLKLS